MLGPGKESVWCLWLSLLWEIKQLRKKNKKKETKRRGEKETNWLNCLNFPRFCVKISLLKCVLRRAPTSWNPWASGLCSNKSTGLFPWKCQAGCNYCWCLWILRLLGPFPSLSCWWHSCPEEVGMPWHLAPLWWPRYKARCSFAVSSWHCFPSWIQFPWLQKESQMPSLYFFVISFQEYLQRRVFPWWIIIFARTNSKKRCAQIPNLAFTHHTLDCTAGREGGTWLCLPQVSTYHFYKNIPVLLTDFWMWSFMKARFFLRT